MQCESVKNGVRCSYPSGHTYQHGEGLKQWSDDPKLTLSEWMAQYKKLREKSST